ncbi:hypothetical protein [Foetidibacter luteolus]|uniref:hypothetical protein n=1 Tax=Foetidibacter luteolus TaxID=2608880 RepID=UPI00129B9AB4|nr:hypothetical protein [Foetidibacter luteolus]
MKLHLNFKQMIKAYFFTALLFCSFTVFGQDKTHLTGKWKIIVFDAIVYHNYKKDSTFIPGEFKESLRGDKDSSFTLGFIAGMIKGFNDYYYVFLENGQYQELKNDKLKQEGVFIVNEAGKELILTAKDKFGGESRQTLLYEINNGNLLLKIPSEGMNLNFELEKVK